MNENINPQHIDNINQQSYPKYCPYPLLDDATLPVDVSIPSSQIFFQVGSESVPSARMVKREKLKPPAEVKTLFPLSFDYKSFHYSLHETYWTSRESKWVSSYRCINYREANKGGASHAKCPAKFIMRLNHDNKTFTYDVSCIQIYTTI